jgi:hypothetical protein
MSTGHPTRLYFVPRGTSRRKISHVADSAATL